MMVFPLGLKATECSLAEVTQRLEICQNQLKSAIGTINEELITMPGPAAIPIVLSQAQQEVLKQIVRCQTSEQRLVRRAQILLKAHAGFNNEQIAQGLSINRETVQRWRQRWSEVAEAVALEEARSITARALRQRIHSILIDRPRPGTPPKFTAQQVVRIVALACEDPQEAGVAVTEWTPRELAQKATERGIVETISPRSVERFLKGG
ncbi:MAG: helix-turn-helix domain-containing protein [Pleurocapsa sp. MO_226.B13]|nr:helix-turn-helix domain-containing protein [Pleurocapsa sp. MO_226.B13]